MAYSFADFVRGKLTFQALNRLKDYIMTGLNNAAQAADAVSTNTVNKIVKRDGSGNFAAGTITANLVGDVTGNASTATTMDGVRVIVTMSSDQSCTPPGLDILHFDTEELDSKNKFDTSTYLCTPGVGVYLVSLMARIKSESDPDSRLFVLQKNGITVAKVEATDVFNTPLKYAHITTLISITNADDTIGVAAGPVIAGSFVVDKDSAATRLCIIQIA